MSTTPVSCEAGVQPRINDAFTATQKAFALVPPPAPPPLSLGEKRIRMFLKFILKLCDGPFDEFVLFGSIVKMMLGFLPFDFNADIDVLVQNRKTQQFMKTLEQFGKFISTTRDGSSGYMSTTSIYVTTGTFEIGKGTLHEDEIPKPLSIVKIDIVEISAGMSFGQVVRNMTPHTISFIAFSPTMFEMVSDNHFTANMGSLEEMIHALKAWKYLTRPEYRDKMLMKTTFDFRWYYHEELRRRLCINEQCTTCQEDFRPKDKVMIFDTCRCTIAYVFHIGCIMPEIIRRGVGIMRALRGTGTPNPSTARCVCNDHYFLNGGAEENGLVRVLLGGQRPTRDYKIESAAFDNIFKCILVRR